MNHKEYLEAKAYVKERGVRDGQSDELVSYMYQPDDVCRELTIIENYESDTIIDTEEDFNLLEPGFYWCKRDGWEPCYIHTHILLVGHKTKFDFKKGMKFKFMEKPGE